MLAAIDGSTSLQAHLAVILTSDHGGTPKGHYDPTLAANYRVPFVIWGPGVTAGDLYALNPDFANPGKRRTTYATAPAPVRNGMVAKVATDLLGLPAVPGSQFDTAQTLDWQ